MELRLAAFELKVTRAYLYVRTSRRELFWNWKLSLPAREFSHDRVG